MSARPARIAYLGVGFDPLDMDAMLAIARSTTPGSPGTSVVTPNVDHVVRLNNPGPNDGAVAAAYAHADISVCDSRIVARLAAMDGIHLPVVPGSDLTERILATVVRPGDRVALVGGDETTVAALDARFPGLDLVQHRPPMGMRRNPEAMAAAADFVEDARARFSFLAVGSPQQELLAALLRDRRRAGGLILCVGASLDFLTGRARRAPRWMQRAHIEWLHRLGSDPARLWRRYLIEAPRIFAIRRRWNRRQAPRP
ncbi:exopolysaccharide biosynthesis WecB/TagA/CpsF family protein [Sphingomonas jejuensis]|uniref:Exopolysaccharide biosynthesis WecB/TagA/CpsF family protein n=1 Tax=Sphingomonas jejuensis TaxID=904715 RepID=A0ABX0XKF7_9SPHN|nr:WecB/TagA/CpsF family glycosyltransferase [Sphingomonas jejuensis]NJC33709.1 exopolysaccharide biosynthesis WecB/TagA/CpsF family protein [Sphingomonas jejuensis]